MVPDGSLTLKGKLLAIPVYAPCVSLARSVSFGALAEAAAHVGVEYMAAVMDLISECQKGRKTPGMIVVKGDQGVGKSKFLHEIMREVVTLKSIHEVQADTVTIHLSSGGDTRPLSFCRQLLCRLLEVHGDSKAAEFSRLEVLKPNCSCSELRKSAAPLRVPLGFTTCAGRLSILRRLTCWTTASISSLPC